MQPIAKGLNDDEIDAVAQYYASLHAVSFPSHSVPEQLRDRGKQVAEVGDLSVRVQACESCHGPNGGGRAHFRRTVLGGQYSHYISVQIQMFRQGYRKSQQMFVPAHNLNEQDIIAVADYFEQASSSSRKVNHREKTCRKKNFTRQRANQRAWHPAPLALRPMKLSKDGPRGALVIAACAVGPCSSQLGCCSILLLFMSRGHVG